MYRNKSKNISPANPNQSAVICKRISVYILGIKDKTYLVQTYGKQIGKASVTGYCIKFKTLKDINIDVLEAAIRYGVEATNES
jgi:hypothetical protein